MLLYHFTQAPLTVESAVKKPEESGKTFKATNSCAHLSMLGWVYSIRELLQRIFCAANVCCRSGFVHNCQVSAGSGLKFAHPRLLAWPSTVSCCKTFVWHTDCQTLSRRPLPPLSVLCCSAAQSGCGSNANTVGCAGPSAQQRHGSSNSKLWLCFHAWTQHNSRPLDHAAHHPAVCRPRKHRGPSRAAHPAAVVHTDRAGVL